MGARRHEDDKKDSLDAADESALQRIVKVPDINDVNVCCKAVVEMNANALYENKANGYKDAQV